MANDNNMHNADLNDEMAEDELFALFSAFDEVSASDDLQNSTLAMILESGDKANDTPTPKHSASDASKTRGEGAAANASDTAPAIKATAGGKQAKTRKRAKWRSIRVAAIAACLALALSGGVAYATPASYYEIAQGNTTITLGVNCFGVTVTASADTEEGKAIVDAAQLNNMPYEDSLHRAIETLEQYAPSEAIEYGPKDGERQHIDAQPDESGSSQNDGQPQGVEPSSQESETTSNGGEQPLGQNGDQPQEGNQNSAQDNRQTDNQGPQPPDGQQVQSDGAPQGQDQSQQQNPGQNGSGKPA